MEKVPSLPMRKEDPPHVCFEKGRSLGRYEIEKIIDEALERLKNAHYSDNLKYSFQFGIGVLEKIKSQIVQNRKPEEKG